MNETTERRGLWIGDMTAGGTYLEPYDQDRFPAITALAQQFGNFRNSAYRYDETQITKMTFGEIKNILAEVSRLMRRGDVGK